MLVFNMVQSRFIGKYFLSANFSIQGPTDHILGKALDSQLWLVGPESGPSHSFFFKKKIMKFLDTKDKDLNLIEP